MALLRVRAELVAVEMGLRHRRPDQMEQLPQVAVAVAVAT
jgi:hypothetical protein